MDGAARNGAEPAGRHGSAVILLLQPVLQQMAGDGHGGRGTKGRVGLTSQRRAHAARIDPEGILQLGEIERQPVVHGLRVQAIISEEGKGQGWLIT